MDSNVRDWLASHGHLITTAELTRLGLDRNAVRRLVRSQQLERLRAGVLVGAAHWHELKPSQRHRVRAEAALISKPAGTIALSHQSSLAMRDVPLFGVSDRTHTLLLHGARNHSTARHAFHVPVDKDQLGVCGEQWRVRDALAALQVADAYGVEAGPVSADALAASGIQRAAFVEALKAGRFERGLARPRQVVELVDGRMESPGESRCRWLLQGLGFSEFEPQVTFRLDNGRLARVDFYLRSQRTVIEFDGLVKYADNGGNGLVAEKLREDGLRALGLEMVRLTWADLSRPAEVRAAIHAAAQRAAGRVQSRRIA